MTSAMSAFQGPMPDVAGDTRRYEEQYRSRYPTKARPALSPIVMQNAATQAFRKTGITVPDELALTQAQFETGFGTRGPNAQNNPYNIGVQDEQTVNYPTSQKQGVQQYYNTMTRDYLKNRDLNQLLDLFVNNAGDRYASDPGYESKLKRQVPIVHKRMQ